MSGIEDQIDAFRQGYLHVVNVLELARIIHTDLHARNRSILNEALDVIIKNLHDNLETTIKEISNVQSRKAPK